LRTDDTRIALEIPREQHGERLDRALAALCKAVGTADAPSRASLQRWIREGRVSVEGVTCTDPSATVRAGASIEIVRAPPPTSEAVPEDLPLHVLFVDDDVIVVDKEAGMVVHPAPGHERGTLVNALLHRFGTLAREVVANDRLRADGEPTVVDGGEDEDDDASVVGFRRPGIVHRLDRWTSGVMVVARTDRARESLMTQLAAHSVDREYLAIVEGIAPERARYETLHGRHPSDRKRFSGRVRRGKRAVTNVERVEVLGAGASLVRCRLETGRTHQIRVHLSEAGFPLLGDAMYGRPPRELRLRVAAEELGRQALHARVLGFAHPGSHERMRFESPIPADFSRALAALR
jgi:23S rRNA pseudouridine1911/1915/1917 synthase